VGQTFDLTIRVRNTGLIVFVGGKQWFTRKGLDDLSESDIQKDRVCMKATLDSFLVRKFELIEASPAGVSDKPPSVPVDVEKPEPTEAATGTVHTLLKPVGTAGGPREWKVTDEGMSIGDAPKGWAYYNSDYSPPGAYDLHVVAEVTKAEDGASLSLIIPAAHGGRLNFDINPRNETSCEAGFAPSVEARKHGANQFRGSFGSQLNVGMKLGQTFDLTIRMRTSGVSVLVGDKPWLDRKGYEGFVQSDSDKRKVCMKATRDTFLIRKFDLVEVP
jgi:hypothetical protein